MKTIHEAQWGQLKSYLVEQAEACEAGELEAEEVILLSILDKMEAIEAKYK